MSSALSRRADQSVVFLSKLIHGLVDCSDLLSQVIFKVNRPAYRTKNTFFLPTRVTRRTKYWTLVTGRPDDDQLQSMLSGSAISTLSLETCNRMLVAWHGLRWFCRLLIHSDNDYLVVR
jgi:hypothetical protein